MTNRNPQEGHPQVRLRNRIMAASILLLAVVNCVAGYFDLHPYDPHNNPFDYKPLPEVALHFLLSGIH